MSIHSFFKLGKLLPPSASRQVVHWIPVEKDIPKSVGILPLIIAKSHTGEHMRRQNKQLDDVMEFSALFGTQNSGVYPRLNIPDRYQPTPKGKPR